MTQDTRKDRRVKIVSLNVRYKSATVDEFIENHAYDVSRGGIFIKTANPFPPGTLLKFEIRLASEQAVIAGVGRIVWKRDAGASSGERPSGMGVKFIKLDEPSKVVIDRLVNTRPDAGRAYEAEDPARAVSDRPVPRATTTARPAPVPAAAASASLSTPSRVPGARLMSPAAGIAAAAKGPSFGPGSPLRKQTMIGVGTSTSPLPPAPSSSPALAGLPSTVPPGRPAFPTAPSAPPRPGGGPSPMFPRGGLESEWPPKQEPTVMKQAAELLEEALREAGGSMEEIGTNPLFSGGGPSTSGAGDPAKETFASAREWTAANTAPSEPQAARDVAAQPGDHDGPASTPSGTLRASRQTPTSVRPASAVARASEPAPAKKKSSAGVVIFWLIAAAAVIAVVVMFRDQLIGGGAAPEPVAAPHATQTAQAPATVASTATTPAASASAAPSAALSATAPTTSAQPSASAAAAGTPTAQKSAEATNVSPPAAPAPPPRQWRPVAKPAAPPAAAATTGGETSGQAAAPAEATPPAATASATPAAPPVKATPPPPRPRAGKPPADDNPY